MNQSKRIRNERDAEEGKVSSVTLVFAGLLVRVDLGCEKERLREGGEGRGGPRLPRSLGIYSGVGMASKSAPQTLNT